VGQRFSVKHEHADGAADPQRRLRALILGVLLGIALSLLA